VVTDTPARFANALKTANELVRPLLRSRLHPLLSRRLMLLDYTGARSGRRYTFPVGYFPWDDGGVLAFSSQRWPAHIRRARGVRLLIRGRWYDAAPAVISDPQAKADLLAEFTRRKGARAARGLMLGLPRNRQASRSELLTAAPKTTITRFTLEPAPDRQAGPGALGRSGLATTRPGTSAGPHQD